MIGVVDARALPLEPEGYNLLKYCWTPANVLGDWAEHAGLTGEMVARALETYSWARDLGRAGYPTAAVAEAIGRYEAALIAAGFTEAARDHALVALVGALEEIRRGAPGATKIFKVDRCGRQTRSLALNHKTVPEGGRARFIPYVLHQSAGAAARPRRSGALRLLEERQGGRADVVRRPDGLQRALAGRHGGDRPIRPRRLARRRHRDVAPAAPEEIDGRSRAGLAPTSAPAP